MRDHKKAIIDDRRRLNQTIRNPNEQEEHVIFQVHIDCVIQSMKHKNRDQFVFISEVHNTGQRAFCCLKIDAKSTVAYHSNKIDSILN